MSIRLRLTIYWTIIIAGILLAAGLLLVFFFSNQMWGRLDSALHEEADTDAAALANLGASERMAMLRHLSREKDLGPRRVRLIVNGRVVFDAGERNADLPALPRKRIERIVDGANHRYRYAVVPLQIDGERAWLQDGVDARPTREAVAHLRRVLLILIPIILLLCVGGGYWLSAEALRPLKEITAGLAGIGPRDLSRRLPVNRAGDEAVRLIDEINQLLARLERASASQRRFVSEAAHELRTPLAVLRTGLEVALRMPRDADENRAALHDALDEVERLCSTAEDLLTLARLDSEHGRELEQVDLSEISAEAGAAGKALAEAKHQTLDVHAARPLIVSGSGRELRRVVLNLLDNAIKFTPDGGKIELSLSQQDAMALLSVCDNGPGIAPGEMPHIFEPFYRSRSAGNGGSGLGLALCHEIVTLHRGTIDAASRIGGGCEIRVRIPLVSA